MSEYQYYEFRAVDRPLSAKEMDELRALSTRAEITATSFTNEYHWGDFRGDPSKLMQRYFDAFVYVANWGTHRLMLRIPRRLLDVEAASAYCDEEVVSLKKSTDHVVLEFRSEDEEGEWAEGEPWMPSLISLRDEILRGDWRALYIGWLASLEPGGWEDEAPYEEESDGHSRREPPVPPGLARLSAAQKALAEFLRVDDDLLRVAALVSEGEAPAGPSRDEIARWLKSLPDDEKDAYLLRLLDGEGDLALRAELLHRFREATAPKDQAKRQGEGARTIADLLAARDAIREARQQAEAQMAARDRAKREREQAEARTKYLDGLAHREPETWKEVETLIASKLPKNYDRAAALLADLRDLAARSGRLEQARTRIRELRQLHQKKPSMIKRIDQLKLDA